jgi:hypothetical protein
MLACVIGRGLDAAADDIAGMAMACMVVTATMSHSSQRIRHHHPFEQGGLHHLLGAE